MRSADQRILSESILAQEALGGAWFGQGEFAPAEGAFHRALAARRSTALTEAKLGACEIQQGDLFGGLARLRRALKREPACAELYDIASAAAMVAGKTGLAAQWAAARLTLGAATAFHFALAAALCDLAGDAPRMCQLLEQGLARFPDDADLRSALCRQLRESPSACLRDDDASAFVA